MFILQRVFKPSLLTALVGALTVSFATAGIGARAAENPDAEMARLVSEIDTGHSLLFLGINKWAGVWSDFQRSRLFREFGGDPRMLAAASQIQTLLDAKLHALDALQKDPPADFTLAQFRQVGPMVGTLNIDPQVRDYNLIRLSHQCDANYLRTLAGLLNEPNGRFLEQLVMQPKPDFQAPQLAYRVRDGWTILQNDRDTTGLINDSRLLLAGATLPESQLLKMQAGPARPGRAEFLAFLKDNQPWISSFYLDFNYLAVLADDQFGRSGPQNPDLFGKGALEGLRAREFVNAAGRFEAVATCAGPQLHKHLLFAGVDKPIVSRLAVAVPEDAGMVLYANLDFGAIMAAGPAQYAGHSPIYAKAIAEYQNALKYMISGESPWSAPPPKDVKIVNPELDSGIQFVLFDPDRIEEMESAFTVSFGIKPGYQPTEAWARMVLQHPAEADAAEDNGGDNAVFKTVVYGGVTIFISERWQRSRCVTVTNTALILGENVKFVKRTIRAQQNIEAEQPDKNNFAEWPAVQALAQREGGNFAGFGLVRVPSLLRKYGPMAIGGLAMIQPGIPTDMNWEKMTANLEPALGVVTYRPETGFHARTLSDLPAATPAIAVALVALFDEMHREGRYWGNNDDDQTDALPPIGNDMLRDNAIDPIPPGAVPLPPDIIEEAVPAE